MRRRSNPSIVQSLEPRLLFAGGPSIGDLDFSFGDHGRVWSIGDEHQFPANLLVQPDASILVAADSDQYLQVFRFAPDGASNGVGQAPFPVGVSAAADNRLTAAFVGDGELVDSIINVGVSGNTGGTFATAVTRPYRKGHAMGYNANALAWIDADGNLIVQGP